MLTKLFNNFMKQKTQVSKSWGSNIIIFKMNSTHTDDIDINLLSSEETDKILNIINYHSKEDLLKYSITKHRAENLELYRTNNGPYNLLKDLLQVKGMNEKSLNKFCKSIISGKMKQPKKITSGLVITPKVIDDSQKGVNTVLGIYIGPNMLSWSLLNRDCELLEWQYKFFLHDHAKQNLHSLLQTTLPIAVKLPKADRYIMQEFGGDTFRKNPKHYQAQLEQSMMNAIILSHLATLNSKFGREEIVTYLSHCVDTRTESILQKIYGLVVGNESVSTQYMLQKLLDENEESLGSKECLPTVLIRPEFQIMYKEQTPINKEQISWSLLIALAFVELIVHERTDMKIRNIV